MSPERHYLETIEPQLNTPEGRLSLLKTVRDPLSAQIQGYRKVLEKGPTPPLTWNVYAQSTKQPSRVSPEGIFREVQALATATERAEADYLIVESLIGELAGLKAQLRARARQAQGN